MISRNDLGLGSRRGPDWVLLDLIPDFSAFEKWKI